MPATGYSAKSEFRLIPYFFMRFYINTTGHTMLTHTRAMTAGPPRKDCGSEPSTRTTTITMRGNVADVVIARVLDIGIFELLLLP